MYSRHNRNNYNYRRAIDSGSKQFNPLTVENPLTYCINDNTDKRFLVGGESNNLIGQQSENCQLFLSEYCAKNWDGFCEIAYNNKDSDLLPNIEESSTAASLNSGEQLLHNTAARKYLVELKNGIIVRKPFDPNVANSPVVSYIVKDPNAPANSYVETLYMVQSLTIDSDPVMNRMLKHPEKYMDILQSIYSGMKIKNKLQELQNTKLGNFYKNNPKFN
jgi:hypothetical protein